MQIPGIPFKGNFFTCLYFYLRSYIHFAINPSQFSWIMVNSTVAKHIKKTLSVYICLPNSVLDVFEILMSKDKQATKCGITDIQSKWKIIVTRIITMVQTTTPSMRLSLIATNILSCLICNWNGSLVNASGKNWDYSYLIWS